jgi:cytidylate kinase
MGTMIIAIDGPAGSGKSTIAQIVAARLGFTYLDTGSMYRTVTLLALERRVLLDDGVALGALAAEAGIEFRPAAASGPIAGGAAAPPRVFAQGQEVTAEIRTQPVTRNVSQVSAHPEVRVAMTRRQRQLAAAADVVMDGRDIGTVVCPGADVKVYLTASLEERARRRQAQLEALGIEIEAGSVRQDMETRDTYDSGRAVAPLCKAEDAVEMDTTRMTISEVVEEVERLAARVSSQTLDSASIGAPAGGVACAG